MLGVAPKVLFGTPHHANPQMKKKKTETPVGRTAMRRSKPKFVECVSSSTQTDPPTECVTCSTQTEPILSPSPISKTDGQTQAPELKAFACPRAVKKDHAYSNLSKKPRKGKKLKKGKKKPTPTVEKQGRDVEFCEESIVDPKEDDVAADKDDPDYKPSSDEDSDDEYYTEEALPERLVNDRKFIVFESQLKELFLQARCSVCGYYFVLDEKQLGSTIGSGLCVKLECVKGHTWVWNSQPMLGRMPAGNILISAAILFSGQTFTHVSSFAGFLNLEFVGATSYGNHQRDYLFPTVHETFESEKQTLWSSLDGRAVRLAGDGRCDSPGYSAKYCTYTVMDLDTEKVVDFEVRQVTQTSSSVAMEKQGFEVVISRLLAHNINVVQICTDRHIGISALMNKDARFKEIDHQVDVWHLGKSVLKKLLVKAKSGESQDLHLWLPSVRNHLWWSSASCQGNSVLLLEKWRSLAHHITDKHEWTANQVFHQCDHEPIDPAVARRKKWLTPDSPAHQAIVSVLNDKSLLNGVKKITSFCHTGPLEVYNGMLTKYTPKRQHFPYESMVVRTKLAVLDHNFNTGRQQAVVKKATAKSASAGSMRYRIVCPKAKKEWVCKAIYEGKKYDYVYDMMASVVNRKLVSDKESSFIPPVLPPNIAPTDLLRQPNADLIAGHVSRMRKEQT